MRIHLIAILPFAALVAGQCSNGITSCCISVQQAHDVTGLSDMCGLTVAEAAGEGLVGLLCSPPVAGVGCLAHQEAVCCTRNEWNGVINVGCTLLG